MNNNLEIINEEIKRNNKWIPKSEYVNAYARQYYHDHTEIIECHRCHSKVVSNKLQRHMATKKCIKLTVQLLKDRLFAEHLDYQRHVDTNPNQILN